MPPGDAAEVNFGFAAPDARFPGLALLRGGRCAARSHQIGGFKCCRHARADAPRIARSRAALGSRHTAMLSISRVVPILAATRMRSRPSLIEVTGASDSACRVSK